MDASDNESILEEHMEYLKEKAKTVENDFVTILNRMKLTQHKLKLELKELSEIELRSKPTLRSWLKSRELPEDCSFQEFFEAFLEEHRKEYRLDLSERSICLNQDAGKLFGLKGKDICLTLPQLLERLPFIYH
jgi:hypothetical protein